MKTIYLLWQFVFISPILLQAQWDGNAATVYNPVCTASTNDQYAFTVTDGAGGIIAVWAENDFATNTAGVYCQHKTSAGIITWGDSSSPVILADDFPQYSSVVVVDARPDGEGGAYISWNMMQNDVSKIYIQHIGRNGALLFPQGGMQVVPVQGSYAYGGKISANATGFFICWSEQVLDFESPIPTYAEVRVQRYGKDGLPRWDTAVAVSATPALRLVGQLASDGGSGVYVAFADGRSSNFSIDNGNADNLDIYAQHISNTGDRLWATDAVVSDAVNNQYTVEDGGSEIFSSMIADSAEGFVLVFYNHPDNNDLKARLYAQRISSNGVAEWASGGVEVFPEYESSSYTVLTQVLPDGAGGIVASLDVNYFSGYSDIYAQRITASGDKAWGMSGSKINPATPGGGFHNHGTLAADGRGSFIAAWTNRLAFAIKAQKINSAGELQWNSEGVDVCANQFSVPSQPVLTKSDSTTVIAVWGDQRNSDIGNASDLYAAKVDGNGGLIHSGVYVTVRDGNWSDAATWLSNSVPPAGADVLVKHAVSGDINAACKSLTVQQPGSLTVLDGVDITVY